MECAAAAALFLKSGIALKLKEKGKIQIRPLSYFVKKPANLTDLNK